MACCQSWGEDAFGPGWPLRSARGEDDECKWVLMSLCRVVQYVTVDSTLPQYNSEEEEQDRRVRRGERKEVEGGGREIQFQRWFVGKKA